MQVSKLFSEVLYVHVHHIDQYCGKHCQKQQNQSGIYLMKFIWICFRMVRSSQRGLFNQNRNILDGELLWKFLQLNVSERAELCKKIGTTADQVSEFSIP